MKALAETVIDDTLQRIRALVGDKGYITAADAMEPHLVEWRGLWRGQARAVVKPADTAEVAEVVKLCAEAGIPIVPQGGNTSLVGGSVPYEDFDGIILSLARMNNVRAIDRMNYTMTVESGCVLADLQRIAEENDRFFPLSLAAEGSCMIGGNLSTNAGGVNVLRYGNTRELVLGLEVVLPDGTVWEGLRGLRKDNTGYDLKHLFVGAEGTLGIVTAAVLKLFPKPTRRETAMVAITGPDAAIELLARARAASADGVTSFELMPRICFDFVLAHIADTVDPLPQRYDWHVLLELSSTAPEDDGLAEKLQNLLEKAAEDGLVLDAAIVQNQAQANAMWKLRETVSEAQKPEGASIKHDVSVPVSRVPEFLRRADEAVAKAVPGIRVVGFGHVGDGNIHYNVSVPKGGNNQAFLARWEEINEIVHDIVHDMGGSISAEHGLGRLKREEITRYKSQTEMDLMRKIKALIDPKGIMNPGKVL